jgi:hypothetical protein
MNVTDRYAAEGTHSLELRSSTGSTKWAYQAVLVEPGANYEAAALAMNVDAREAFLRVSWYASEDGSGEALDSSDSGSVVLAGSPVFERVATGVVRAPSEARSAKVRLMLRPGSGGSSTVYFDAVTLNRAVSPGRTGEPDRRPPLAREHHPANSDRPACRGESSQTGQRKGPVNAGSNGRERH